MIEITSPSLSAAARKSILLAYAKEKPHDALSYARQFASDPDPVLRLAAAGAFGIIGGREGYSSLVDLLHHEQDREVQKRAIIELGSTRDSRALFALVNIYRHWNTSNQISVLSAIHILSDPRSSSFLEDLLTNPQALDALGKNLTERAFYDVQRNPEFSYTFLGKEEDRMKEYDQESHLVLASPEDLLELPQSDHPFSYVITQDHQFVTAPFHQVEHISLAKGRDVAAAGEFNCGSSSVVYINNRSYGFYPAPTSVQSVNKAFHKIGIPPLKQFTETFPKEGYFTPAFLSQFPFSPSEPQ
ncbi:HEAT repeat domain-containing protein [Candidatus Woesearchaeota archaeon]|nr:HEAT repeat domain-containing protein [Candidatus Woesearchaeota archaeon]